MTSKGIKIARNIPSPQARVKPRRKYRYPWLKMGVDDSFIVTGNSARICALQAAANKGIKAESEKISGDKRIAKYRLWRVL